MGSYTKGKKARGGHRYAKARGFQAWLSTPAPLLVQGGFQNPHQYERI